MQAIRHFCSLTPKVGAQVDLPPSTHYVEGLLRFSRYTSLYYVNGWCPVVVAVNSPMRVDARSCLNVFGTSDSKYYRTVAVGRVTSRFALPHQVVGFSCRVNFWSCSGDDFSTIVYRRFSVLERLVQELHFLFE